jgi:hypothetical protein
MKKIFDIDYEGRIEYFRIENDERGVSKMRIMFKVRGIACGLDLNFRTGKITLIGKSDKYQDLQ